MQQLAEPPTVEEIRATLNRLATGKAPGLTNLVPVDARKPVRVINLDHVTADLIIQ